MWTQGPRAGTTHLKPSIYIEEHSNYEDSECCRARPSCPWAVQRSLPTVVSELRSESLWQNLLKWSSWADSWLSPTHFREPSSWYLILLQTFPFQCLLLPHVPTCAFIHLCTRLPTHLKILPHCVNFMNISTTETCYTRQPEPKSPGHGHSVLAQD